MVPSELKSGRQIVTRLPDDGTALSEGDVALTVSGRPVFLLEGSEPSYRDLGPGIVGEDVRQLEQALERLGFDPGPADGVYDAGTEAAVAELYGAASYEPARATEEQLAAIRPLEADLVENARAGAGVQLPADEVIFVEPSRPGDGAPGRPGRSAGRPDHDGHRRGRGDRQLGSDRGGFAPLKRA